MNYILRLYEQKHVKVRIAIVLSCHFLCVFPSSSLKRNRNPGSLRVQVAESFIEGARAALGGQGQQRRVGQGGPKIGQPRPSHGPEDPGAGGWPENGKFTKEPWNQQLVYLVGGIPRFKNMRQLG